MQLQESNVQLAQVVSQQGRGLEEQRQKSQHDATAITIVVEQIGERMSAARSSGEGVMSSKSASRTCS
eukprot:7168096-Lingulodinium_polyedra.AAC.1